MPDEHLEELTATVHELLTDEQMLLRIQAHCQTHLAVELNVDVDSEPTWEVSWYCVPRPDEPQDKEYGGHWAVFVRSTLHDAITDSYRHVFPDLADPS